MEYFNVKIETLIFQNMIFLLLLAVQILALISVSGLSTLYIITF